MLITETKNLILMTFTADAMVSVLNGENELEIEKQNYRFASGWPIPVYKNLFPYKISRFQTHPKEEEYEGMIIHKRDKLIIGDMGFKGGPDENGVMEIGYSIAPNYQGEGYATEMGKAFCKWGLQKANVTKIIAICSVYNYASIRVLEKMGMRKLKEEIEKYYWYLPRK
ncbi:GNAT family N-acetyltransferase [Gottfriedia sp. NPDC056225]|uniref:GNAT family N-acetyltransferase n=1 Tax=Gottfriedia sp. NPDC056225 TaxID=3345751 RepID=UPI001559461A|nr:GNAT family N-acetyltransferase [Arthrobacter citreus]